MEMTEREDAISRIERVIQRTNNSSITVTIPKYTARLVVALLKEQGGKPLIENERGWNCPSCGMNLIGKTASGYPCDLIDLPEDEPIHFCPMCGQAVIWE